MGRILKLVYSNSVELHGRTYHLSNGLPKKLVDHVQACTVKNDSFNSHENISYIERENPNWRGHFTLNNFYYYFQNFYGKENIISVDNVIDDSNVIYAYPIEINTTINALTDEHQLTINGETLAYTVIDTFEPKILELMRKGQLKIILSNIQDPCSSPASSVYEFEKVLKSNGISESNLICIFGNSYSVHTKTFPESRVKFTYGILPLQQQSKASFEFPRMTSLGYVSDIVRKEDIDRLKNTIRPKKFLSFNRSLRSHRYYLAYLAMKYSFLHEGIFSFINVPDTPARIKNQIEMFEGRPITDKEFYRLMNHFPIELDTETLDANQKRGFTTDSNKKEWYLDSYIHLTSETSFVVQEIDEPFFSEKTFRPINNLQPFIYLGNAYALKKLQSLGFKTFHPYIDESYDNEPDHIKRMKLIKTEILKLVKMPKKDLHNLYYSLQHITLHNFEVFISYKDSNPFEIAVNDIVNFNYD